MIAAFLVCLLSASLFVINLESKGFRSLRKEELIVFSTTQSLAILICLMMVKIIFNISFSYIIFFLYFLAFGFLAWAVYLSQKVKTVMSFLIVLTALFAFMAFTDYWISPVVSFDSIIQLSHSYALGSYNAIELNNASLASWGVGLIALHALNGAYLDNWYVVGLHPLLLLCCASFLAVCMVRSYKLNDALVNRGVIFVFLLLWLSTSFVIFQGFYIHNQSLTLLFFLCLIILIHYPYEKSLITSIVFIFVSVAFAVSRTEAVLYLCVAYGSMIFINSGNRSLIKEMVLSLCFSSLWLVWLNHEIGTGSDILTPQRLALLLTFSLFTIIALIWFGYGMSLKLVTLVQKIIFVLPLFACLVLFLAETNVMISNIKTIVVNLTSVYWSFFWIAIIPLILLATIVCFQQLFYIKSGEKSLLPVNSDLVALTFVAISLICLILLFGHIRIPYRTGWGDSANRLFFIISGLSILIANALLVHFESCEKIAKKFSLKPVFFAGIILATTFVYPVVLPIIPSKNLALKSSIINQIGIRKDFPFEQALDGSCDLDKSYVAARVSGEASVTLQLKEPSMISIIDLCYYEGQHWNNFRIFSGAEVDNLSIIYSQSSKSVDFQTDGNLLRIKLQNPLLTNYLKIEFFGSEGQNRLLLRGLRIY